MGTAQSKASEVAVHEQVVERLRALDLKTRQQQVNVSTTSEKGYVLVNNNSNKSDDPSPEPPMSRTVSISAAEQWEKELMEDPKNRLAISAFTANPATSIICSRAAKISDIQTFNVSIPMEGSPVTNQRSSGRCWLFAATNVFRIALMKQHNLKEFQLSQAYLFFWDKLEKANYFLESVLETSGKPLDGRLLQDLMMSPVGDGGQWDMVANLVEKYGLVPQVLYPDSFNAMNSSTMSKLITTKLREDAIRLRELAAASKTGSSLAAAKALMMREIHLILTLMLGPPPSPTKEFTWQYYDKNNKYQTLVTTPLKFSQELSTPAAIKACGGTDVHRLFSLVHDPRNDFETLLTVDRLGNVWGGRRITYVNVKMSTLKAACIAMLKAGLPVFFGSDVGQYSSREGFMDLALYDWTLGFNVQLGMSKAERLRTHESQMTHAMVLTAVHLDEGGKSVRWRIENSWSEAAGDKGYMIMTDAWMDEFVYQAVVDPKFVGSSVLDVLETEPKVLPHWDPMGALA